MTPEIIVMLTHNDVTVPNSRELFASAADLDVQYWGLKDVGLDVAEMAALVGDFRAAGKTPVLEVVNFDEKELREAAALAVECGVGYFTGALFSETVMKTVHAAGMKYFPFCGAVGGHPITLSGTPASVVEDARRLRELGVDGVDLVAYRYGEGDPVELATTVAEKLGSPQVIVAGSINSIERMQRMNEIGPFAYTMGGALFDAAFVPGGTFRENLEFVVNAGADLAGASL